MNATKITYITGNSFNNSGDIAMVNGFVQTLESRLPGVHVRLIGHDLARMKVAFANLLDRGHSLGQSVGASVTPHAGSKYLAHLAKSLIKGTPRKQTVEGAVRQLRTSSSSGKLAEFAEGIQGSQALVFGGGGYLNDLFGFMEAALVTCEAARAQQIPIFALGQSVGPFHGERGLQTLKRIVDMVEFLEVREEAGSLPNLERSGCDMRKIVRGADSAMLIGIDDPDAADQYLAEKFGRKPERLITLNPRFFRESNDSVTLDKHIAHMTEVVDRLIDRFDADVLSIVSLYRPDVAGAEEPPHMDLPVSERIRSGLRNKDRFFIMERPVSIELTKAIHREALLSISIAYHACLFALSAGTPCLCCYTDEYMRIKNGGLADLFEVPELAVDLYGSGGAEAILERAQDAVDARDAFRYRLLARTSELRGRVEQSVDRMLSQLRTEVTSAL